MTSPNSYKIPAFAIVAISSLIFTTTAHATIFDYFGANPNEGIVKASSGNHYLIEGSKVTAITPEKAIQMQHKFPIHTTKGPQQVEFIRGATAHLPAVGKAVTTLAKSAGPIGFTISALSLMCDLTNICNSNGEFSYTETAFPAGSGTYPTCQQAIGLSATENFPNCDTLKNNISGQIFWFRAPSAPDPSAGCTNHGGTSWTYTVFAYTCTNAPTTSRSPTEADYTAKEPLLNDERFVPELVTAKQPVPINLPQMVMSPMRKPLTTTTEDTMNSSGTKTGTKETTTELEITDASTPDKPNQIDVKEKTTITLKDLQGLVIGQISNSTTEISQQKDPAPAAQLCGLPGQEPCNVLVDERGVQTAIDQLAPLGQAATQNITSIFESTNQSITNRSGGVGQGFQWPWQISSGNCYPLIIDQSKGLIIDFCPHIPLIHSILSYIFYVLTAISIFNVFFQPKTT